MSILESLVNRAGHNKQLDKPAQALSKVADTTLSNQALTDALSGKQLGHPLHPAAVLVPMGVFTTVSLIDFVPALVGDSKAAQRLTKRLISVGLLSSVPAAAAGLSDWRYTSGPEKRIGVIHAACNSVALSLYGSSLILRSRNKHAAAKVMSLFASSVLGASGYLGGHLAYVNGVGVDTNAFGKGPTKWTRVAAESEIDNEMRVFEVDGARVLITRVDGSIVAIANRCSHRGAPLNEGKREGDCVSCPWHQSEFGLTDGEVRRGPAVVPQHAYDVRVIGLDVEIRHRADHGDLTVNVD